MRKERDVKRASLEPIPLRNADVQIFRCSTIVFDVVYGGGRERKREGELKGRFDSFLPT
jgi:hypothetical protein